MPYAPQTQYRGDQYIFQGGRDTATALSGWLENFLNQQKQVNAAGKSADYFVKANPDVLNEMGVHPDEWANLGARDKANAVQGYIQGKATQRATAEAQAQVQLRQAEAAKAQTEADSTAGMPQFAQFLNEELSRPTTTTTPSWPPPGGADWNSFLQGNGPVQTPGPGAGPGAAPMGLPAGMDLNSMIGNGAPPAAAQPQAPETSTGAMPAGPPSMSGAVLRALGRVQNLNPRVAAALATKILPGIIQNSTDDAAPQVTNLNGTPVIWKRGSKEFQADPTALVGARLQAQTELLQQKNALHTQLLNNGFKPAINSATKEIIPDVYTDPNGKTVDLRSGITKMTGAGGAAGTPAVVTPAAVPGARVQVMDKKGNKFTVPQEQLADALKQGYTQP